jgi:hypothetical protein
LIRPHTIFFLLCLFGFYNSCFAQNSDTLKNRKAIQDKKATKKALGFITRRGPGTPFNFKSEDPFLPYEGKIIRKIVIDQIGFERNVQDTTQRFKTFIANTANTLHNDTKRWVIHNNLFLREGKPLNPYRVADNERYLRDLDFILDTRIFVLPISEDSDSVDLLVMTRDVFSLGATFSPRSPTEYRFKVQEANLAGMGQRLQVRGIYDTERAPSAGYEFLYQKTNLFGSFINATAAYTEINSGISVGNENESAYLFRLSRPLYHPFARWAGAMELSRNRSRNSEQKQDSVFARYAYNIQDYWAGYSFGHQKLPSSLSENRNRKFIALRGFQEHFTETPTTPIRANERLVYSDRVTLLSQLTFFKGDFYKTQYVLGFGRTEDIPYGYRVSFTGGWEEEIGRRRLYSGAELFWSTVNNNGTFINYTVKLGNYWSKDLIEDALAQFNISRYSRIYLLCKSKVRHQADLGFATLINPAVKRKLDINDLNGLNGFKPDTLAGDQRLTFRTEAVVYTPVKFLGFHLAPVVRVDLAYISSENEKLFQKRNFYSGFSAALRARNENLIFNTVEARIYYYPKTVEGLSQTRLEFRTNLRIKYPTNLVTAPATVYDP